MGVKDLPTLNACLNATSAIFLVSGFLAIIKGNKKLHIKLMMGALIVSTLFLSSYLYYHFNVTLMTKYQGEGLSKWIYFAILSTHIPLAVFMVPFIIYGVIKAFKGQFLLHKKVMRYVFPVWLYVSVTGVIIYLMLYVF